MTEPKQSFTEFWIIPDSTQLLNNRKHVVYDKEQHDELYFNDGEAYDDYFKPKAIHVIEHSALVAERARCARLESTVEAFTSSYPKLEKGLFLEQQKNAKLESENAALKEELERVRGEKVAMVSGYIKADQLRDKLQDGITTLRAKVVRARELYELATRELVKRDAADTDEYEGQEAAVDSWMADYDLELQKKGQGDDQEKTNSCF